MSSALTSHGFEWQQGAMGRRRARYKDRLCGYGAGWKGPSRPYKDTGMQSATTPLMMLYNGSCQGVPRGGCGNGYKALDLFLCSCVKGPGGHATRA